MFNGTLKNTYVADRPLLRLTIGITNHNGHRAALEFVRDNETSVLCAQIPSEQEMDEQYLTVNDWERQTLAGLGEVWSDAIGGGDYTLESALVIQASRDARDYIAEIAPVAVEACLGPQEPDQNDYRIFNRRRPDGTFPPLADFFDGAVAKANGQTLEEYRKA